MKKYYIAFSFFVFCIAVHAQPTNGNIPLARQYFHETIRATQKKIRATDGKDDTLFTPTTNEQLNLELTNALTNGVAKIEALIEEDSGIDNNSKIKFLRGLNETLTAYLNGCRYDSLKYSELPNLLNAYRECMILENSGASIEQRIASYSYETGNILIYTIAFSNNSGIENCRDIVLLKYCDKYKQKALDILSLNPNLPFTDSLITVIARRDPENLYTYAAATTALATKIRNNPDTLVHVISQMAQLKSGRQLFPFLDNLYRGKLTFEKIDSALNDSIQYYQLLVQTSVDYAYRLSKRDTPMAMSSLYAKLQKKAIDPFINTINGLHEAPDEIRFRSLKPFNARDLYYMAVTGEEVIYTSSYVRGVYPRIWQNMKNPKSDSLLMSVRFDRFRKWIKMASNYNTLDDFLKRMDNGNAQMLMKAFVNGLDKTVSLEDAVDVANSYASITNTDIQKLILTQVGINLQQAKNTQNLRATDIYGILNTLFLSMDTANHIDVSQTLGVPPVYYMPSKNLQDSNSKIIIQEFFYGDDDGRASFNSFIRVFSNSNWKITHTEEWVSITAAKGANVVIYANKPLDEKNNLDTKAQADLDAYLFNNDLNPTIVIHRGHSYWLTSTIDQLASSARVILLGSCGAYQSLDKILKICPSAQIIASKQTGSYSVNDPMIYAILETLRLGKDLNWPQLWAGLSKSSGNSELFDDYVPPHKNLGALFLMAYKKMQEKKAGEN
ncbi:MAG TPA: hypothetical protein PLP23_19750 [Panacibacter sp.]|nr:hypothetical protein [Panacibacter sp.]